MSAIEFVINLINPDNLGVSYAIGPLAIAGAMSAYNLIQGAVGKGKANRAIKELEQNHPDMYDITPEQQMSFERAQKMANSGYSPQEKAAFLGNVAGQNNQQYYKSTAMGGQTLAGATRAGINYGNSRALNDFAAQDAALKRQNVRYADQMGGRISNQRNMKTQAELSEYNRKMQAYGQASQDNSMRMDNAINFFGAMAGSQVGGGAGAAGGGGAATPGVPYSGPPMANYGLGAAQGSGVDWSNPYGSPVDNSQYQLTDPNYTPNFQDYGMMKPRIPMENYVVK